MYRLAICSAALLAPAAPAPQAVPRSDARTLALFEEVVAAAARSTVRVKSDGRDAALGTVVTADGYVVTKASELKGKKTVCRFPDGKDREVVRVAEDESHDLALLKVEATGLTPVTWADTKAARPGRWVAAPGAAKAPAGVGVFGVATRDLTAKGAAGPPNPNSGVLGVVLDIDAAGAKVKEVNAGSPALKVGLKPDDVITGVNGQAVTNGDEFIALLQRLKAGDEVALKVTRGEKELDVKATLAKRTGNTKLDTQNSWGSQLSDRRTGFPTVLQNDAVLKPADCGGPLVDLDGRVIGVNIARAGRTETYAVPAEVVAPLVEKLKAAEKK